jgi:SAM-dependent methyltransferase
MSRDWKLFWAEQNDPRHPKAADFLPHHGGEFALVGIDPAGKRVLELGCGSGSLFEAVGFDRANSYRGVDFSDKMLEVFRATHPGVDVACADASSYVDDSRYDLIFSNQLAQYFTRNMLARYVANARRMLAPGGTIVIGSIPWRGARAAFHLQSYWPAGERRPIRGVVALVRSYFGVDRIGRWYSYRELAQVSRKHGLAVTYFGCLKLPYRFHVRMDDSTHV